MVAKLPFSDYGPHAVTTIVRRSAAGSPKLSAKLVIHWAERMLKVLSREEAELSILLTNDRGIQRLNRDYRDKDRPTDVLSFHFDAAGIPACIEAEWLLGDIVISLDTALRQAESRRRPIEEEVRWLLAHGILHLIGYDHTTAEEKRLMVSMTRKLVRAAGEVPPKLAAAAPTTGQTRRRTTTSSVARCGPVTANPARMAPKAPVKRVSRDSTSPRRTGIRPGLKQPRGNRGQKKTRQD